ncbi:hypothetical protein ACFP3I_07365 [Chryseobacterium arachidis]|uniref:hypothetical protein n=1 Tax=Chryseobacterium arachidis TaxID=1416778 RepID=UPI0036209368
MVRFNPIRTDFCFQILYSQFSIDNKDKEHNLNYLWTNVNNETASQFIRRF